MTNNEQDGRATYHVTESGTKWPNCLVCHSEDTTVVPKTGEWTCQDCGHQWHSDETHLDDGDAADIGGEIEGMLRAISEAERHDEVFGRGRDRRFGGERR